MIEIELLKETKKYDRNKCAMEQKRRRIPTDEEILYIVQEPPTHALALIASIPCRQPHWRCWGDWKYMEDGSLLSVLQYLHFREETPRRERAEFHQAALKSRP
jgi:hypothetical protein